MSRFKEVSKGRRFDREKAVHFVPAATQRGSRAEELRQTRQN